MDLKSKRYILIISVVFLILACETTYYPLDPTQIAPQNLVGEDFAFHVFRGVDLSGKNFADANLHDAIISSTDFTHANLENTNLSNAQMGGNNFNYSNLQGADLSYAYTSFQEESPSTFYGADLRGVKFEHTCIWADYTGAILDPDTATIFDVLVHGIRDWRKSGINDLSNTCFSTEYLKLNDLIYSSKSEDFRGIDFSNAHMNHVTLDSLDMSYSDFSYAQLVGAHLGGTINVESNFYHADLSEAFLSAVNFMNADLSYANLDGAWISSGDFRGANLTGVNFHNIEILEYGDFWGATVDYGALKERASSSICVRMPDGKLVPNNSYCNYLYADQNSREK